MTTPSLDPLRTKLASETGLAEVVTLRKSGTPLVSVINAGIVEHPADGREVVAFVSGGSAARLGHLRRDPRITMAVRRSWDWAGLEGTAELAGPNDSHPDVSAEALPGLLRTIFGAAGGTHDDYEEFDRAMVEDQRCAILITPTRVYGNNPAGG